MLNSLCPCVCASRSLADSCVVLNNLAELVVRHLEKDIALQVGSRSRYPPGPAHSTPPTDQP